MGLLSGLTPPPSSLPGNITANPNAGIFERAGSAFLRNGPPIVSAPYNALNTLAHLLQGTAGEHGAAPTLFGKILQWANPSFDQGAAAAGQPPPDGATNNPPAYGAAPSGAPAAGQGGPGGVGAGWKQAFDSGRFPGAPAFTTTLPQFMFPGSPIGPTSGLITNPYDPEHPLSRAGAQDTSIPGFAQAFRAWLLSRNQQ